MARQVHRMFDISDKKTKIISIPQTKVFSEGLLIAVTGSLTDSGATTVGTGKFFIEGMQVVANNDVDTDGAIREIGSTKIFIG